MCHIEKHLNYEEELLAVCEGDSAKFELLSLIVDWALERFSILSSEDKLQLEVTNGLYILQINRSLACDIGVKVMFGYNERANIITLYSLREFT